MNDNANTLQPTCNNLATDCISRHGVSAWLDNMGYPRLADAIMDEKRFPSAQRRIPVTEGLPNNELAIVQYGDGDFDLLQFPTAYRREDIVAWMSLSELWKGESEG